VAKTLGRLISFWTFDRVLKGRGFSRAVSAAKSPAALAAVEIAGIEKTFSAACEGASPCA
jgi:hypothetical protein